MIFTVTRLASSGVYRYRLTACLHSGQRSNDVSATTNNRKLSKLSNKHFLSSHLGLLIELLFEFLHSLAADEFDGLSFDLILPLATKFETDARHFPNYGIAGILNAKFQYNLFCYLTR